MCERESEAQEKNLELNVWAGPLGGLRCRGVDQDRQNQMKYNKLPNKINVGWYLRWFNRRTIECH